VHAVSTLMPTTAIKNRDVGAAAAHFPRPRSNPAAVVGSVHATGRECGPSKLIRNQPRQPFNATRTPARAGPPAERLRRDIRRQIRFKMDAPRRILN
jgi:hypothetical protein